MFVDYLMVEWSNHDLMVFTETAITTSSIYYNIPCFQAYLFTCYNASVSLKEAVANWLLFYFLRSIKTGHVERWGMSKSIPYIICKVYFWTIDYRLEIKHEALVSTFFYILKYSWSYCPRIFLRQAVLINPSLYSNNQITFGEQLTPSEPSAPSCQAKCCGSSFVLLSRKMAAIINYYNYLFHELAGNIVSELANMI